MKTVELFGYPYPLLIIPCKSGITITNSAGGLRIRPRSVEGIILPVPFARNKSFTSPLEYFRQDIEFAEPGCGDIDHPAIVTEAEANETDALFEKYGIPLKVNRDKLDDSMEAWLHVHLLATEDEANYIIKDFVGQEAILTWENCD